MLGVPVHAGLQHALLQRERPASDMQELLRQVAESAPLSYVQGSVSRSAQEESTGRAGDNN